MKNYKIYYEKYMYPCLPFINIKSIRNLQKKFYKLLWKINILRKKQKQKLLFFYHFYSRFHEFKQIQTNLMFLSYVSMFPLYVYQKHSKTLYVYQKHSKFTKEILQVIMKN